MPALSDKYTAKNIQDVIGIKVKTQPAQFDANWKPTVQNGVHCINLPVTATTPAQPDLYLLALLNYFKAVAGAPAQDIRIGQVLTTAAGRSESLMISLRAPDPARVTALKAIVDAHPDRPIAQLLALPGVRAALTEMYNHDNAVTAHISRTDDTATTLAEMVPAVSACFPRLAGAAITASPIVRVTKADDSDPVSCANLLHFYQTGNRLQPADFRPTIPKVIAKMRRNQENSVQHAILLQAKPPAGADDAATSLIGPGMRPRLEAYCKSNTLTITTTDNSGTKQLKIGDQAQMPIEMNPNTMKLVVDGLNEAQLAKYAKQLAHLLIIASFHGSEAQLKQLQTDLAAGVATPLTASIQYGSIKISGKESPESKKALEIAVKELENFGVKPMAAANAQQQNSIANPNPPQLAQAPAAGPQPAAGQPAGQVPVVPPGVGLGGGNP